MIVESVICYTARFAASVYKQIKPPSEVHIQRSNRRMINTKSQEGTAKVENKFENPKA